MHRNIVTLGKSINSLILPSMGQVVLLYSHVPYHNDTRIRRSDKDRLTQKRRRNKRRWKTFLTKYLPLTLLQGFEKVVWGFTVRGSWRSNITAIFWPQNLWPSALCLSCSLDAQPGPLCWMLAFFTASYQHLLWTPNSIGVPEGPPPRSGVAFPTTSRLQLSGTLLATPLACRTQLALYNRSTPTRSLKSNV